MKIIQVVHEFSRGWRAHGYLRYLFYFLNDLASSLAVDVPRREVAWLVLLHVCVTNIYTRRKTPVWSYREHHTPNKMEKKNLYF